MNAGTVGVRELKAHLSQYLNEVQSGRELLVTDRGKPVARLSSPSLTVWQKLVDQGLVTPAQLRWGKQSLKRTTPMPIKTAGTVSDLVADQRG